MDNWFLGKVDVKSSDLVAETLKNRLTDHQKMLFRSTCFGKYLDIHEIAVNPQLIHQVLLREVNQPNDDEMWFTLGNDRLKFGMEEFYLITGLQCKGDVNRVKYDTKYCRLNNEYFSHLTHITNDDIFNVFQAMPNHNNRDVVLMGILFLLTQLMYNTAYDRYVDETLLVLVDSTDMNAYPWGHDIFRLTLSSLKQALRNKRITIEGEGRPAMSYRLNGFVLAFQVWIYEILPILEMKLCSKVASKRPRILNWSSEVDDDIPNINLATNIFGHEDFRVVPIVPQVAEALDRNYVSLKRKVIQPNRPNIVSARSIIINDDDDFVIPPQPRQQNRHPIAVPQATLTDTKGAYSSDKYNFEDTPIVKDNGLRDVDDICDHEIDVHRSKGKNVVYDVADSDDECELISPICNPNGIYNFPAGSSSSPFVDNPPLVADETISIENQSAKQCDKYHNIGVPNHSSKADIHQSYTSNSTRSNMDFIGKKPDPYQAANITQDHRLIFDKYTSRLDDIVGGHAAIAVELFILKKKMEELVQFVNDGITEAIECLHTRCLNTNRPRHVSNLERPPTQGGTRYAGQQGSHAASIQASGKGIGQPSKSTGRPVIPLQDSTNTYLRRAQNLSRNYPVSCTRGSIQPPSKCGSNSIHLQSSNMAQKSPNLHEISKDSSIIGKRVEFTPQAPTPSDKGSIAKPVTGMPCNDSTNSVNMFPHDYDAPSFDLGIDSDIHDGGIVLDDGLFLSNQYLDEMDELAAVRLSRSQEMHKQPQDMNLKAKCSTQTLVQANHSAPASQNPSYPCTKDDGIAKLVIQSTPAKKMRPKHFINAEISPIPINFQDEAIPVDSNLIHHTSVTRSVHVETVSTTTHRNFFVYKTCLDPPSEFDITRFKSFYHAAGHCEKGMNVKDAVVVFSTPMKLGPITIDTMAWWHDLHEVARSLNDTHIDVVFYFMRGPTKNWFNGHGSLRLSK